MLSSKRIAVIAIATAAGCLLAYANIYFTGFAAALSVPHWFGQWGKAHPEPMLITLDIAYLRIPQLLMSFAIGIPLFHFVRIEAKSILLALSAPWALYVLWTAPWLEFAKLSYLFRTGLMLACIPIPLGLLLALLYTQRTWPGRQRIAAPVDIEHQ